MILGSFLLLSSMVMLGQNTYKNPVKATNLPDPSVIYGQDGWFYVYATENGSQSVPIYKSKNMVNWRLAGAAFQDDAHRPSFVKDGSVWAPEIAYVGGKYVIYYSMSTWGGEWECGIGIATSDVPQGPFTDHGKLFISSEIGVKNSIDPCFYHDADGKNYLFWGSFRGIFGIELTEDGLSLKPGAEKFQIGPGCDGNVDNTEGTMLYKRGDYYYYIGSSGTCCEGVNSTYHLVVARAKKITGPYVNRAGYSIMNHPYETILSKSDMVLGPGHNSEVIEDDNGKTWILYHGFQASHPEAGRVLYLDELKWDQQGWPYIEQGKPSGEAEAPYFKDYHNVTGIEDIQASTEGYSITKGSGNYYQIYSPDKNKFEWNILDANGNVVRTGAGCENKELWINDLSAGIYILQVRGPLGVLSQKIIKSC